MTNLLGLTLKVSYPKAVRSPWQIKDSHHTYGTLFYGKPVNTLDLSPFLSFHEKLKKGTRDKKTWR